MEPNHNKPKKVKVEGSNGNVKASDGHAKGGKGISKEIHSIEEGKNMFQWIMDGVDVDEFMK